VYNFAYTTYNLFFSCIQKAANWVVLEMIYSLTVTLTACRSEILGASMLCRVLWNGKRQRVQQIVIHLYNIWSDQGKIVHPFFYKTLKEQIVRICVTCGCLCIQEIWGFDVLLGLLTLTDCLDRHQLAIYLAKEVCCLHAQQYSISISSGVYASTFPGFVFCVDHWCIHTLPVPDCSHSLFCSSACLFISIFSVHSKPTW
jgi:hypothetical protein